MTVMTTSSDSRGHDMTLSPEQADIVEAVRSGNCVAITSSAGSGKTTTLLRSAEQIATDGGRKTMLVLYNRDLCDDVTSRVKAAGLTDFVSCFTVHALLTRVSRTTCHTDRELLIAVRRLEEESADVALPSPSVPSFDTLMIDEIQDMSPLLYRAVVCVVRLAFAGRTSLQVVVCGDLKQRLYGYRVGELRATGEYLRNAETYFGPPRLTCSADRTWRRMSMMTSFRLTPKVAAVVNAFWGTSIVPGNRVSEDIPVEYWVKNTFPSSRSSSIDIKALQALIDHYGQQNVMFLVNSTQHATGRGQASRKPIVVIENALLGLLLPDGTPKYRVFVSGSESTDAECARGKLRIMTFCASKGSEAKCVVVFGIDVFNPEMMTSRNQIGVALSRARERLIIVHGGSCNGGAMFEPNPYYPAPLQPGEQRGGGGEDQDVDYDVNDDDSIDEEAVLRRGRMMHRVLDRLVDRGVITVEYGSSTTLPAGKHQPRPGDNIIAVCASDRDIASSDHISALLALGEWTTATDAEAVDASEPVVFESRIVTPSAADRNVGPEDVSALYGIAMNFALQMHVLGYCTDIEERICSLVLGDRVNSKTISYEAFVRSLVTHGVQPLSDHQHELVHFAFHDPSRPEEWRGHLQLPLAVDLVNRKLDLRKRHASSAQGRSVRVFAVTKAKYVEDLKGHIDDIALAYESLQLQYAAGAIAAAAAVAAAAADVRQLVVLPTQECAHLLVYLASASSAFMSFHYRFLQLGTTAESYRAWVDASAIDRGMQNIIDAAGIRGMLDDATSGEFEAWVDASIPTPFRTLGGTVTILAGRADWMRKGDAGGGDDVDDTVFELKFVNELNDEHRIQTLVYAALATSDRARGSTAVLFNARTCERERVRVADLDTAKRIIDAAARIKRADRDDKSAAGLNAMLVVRTAVEEDGARFREFEEQVRLRRMRCRAKAEDASSDEGRRAEYEMMCYEDDDDHGDDANAHLEAALLIEDDDADNKIDCDEPAKLEIGDEEEEDDEEDDKKEEVDCGGNTALVIVDDVEDDDNDVAVVDNAARLASVYGGDAESEAVALVLDTETSALTGVVIQLGWVLVAADATVLRSYERLFRLPPGEEMCPRAHKVHGISEDDLELYGAEDVRAELAAFKSFIGTLMERNVAIVAHNASFDAGRLNHTAAAWSLPDPTIITYAQMRCTMNLGLRTGRFVNAQTGRKRRPQNVELYSALFDGRAPDTTNVRLHTARDDATLTAAAYCEGLRKGWW